VEASSQNECVGVSEIMYNRSRADRIFMQPRSHRHTNDGGMPAQEFGCIDG
jgi:hypothetical protein